MKEPAHRALHPFGQIPTYEEDGLALFESGAIVFHVAERHAGLLPGDANARALRLKVSGMLDEYPNLSAYAARGEARPAYERAFDAQLAAFTGKPPGG